MQPSDRAYWSAFEQEAPWTARATAPIARPEHPAGQPTGAAYDDLPELVDGDPESPTGDHRSLIGPNGERQTPEAIVEGLWAAVQRSAGREADDADPSDVAADRGPEAAVDHPGPGPRPVAEVTAGRQQDQNDGADHRPTVRMTEGATGVAAMPTPAEGTEVTQVEDRVPDALLVGVRKLITGGLIGTEPALEEHAGPAAAIAEPVTRVVGRDPHDPADVGFGAGYRADADDTYDADFDSESGYRTDVDRGPDAGSDSHPGRRADVPAPTAHRPDPVESVPATPPAGGPVTSPPVAVDDAPAGERPLLDPALATSIRDRWSGLQSSFVDDPEGAVADAGRLASDAISSMIESLELMRRAATEQIGDAGGTEDLRLNLLHIRETLDRLLQM
jgi:hypothetical protein